MLKGKTAYCEQGKWEVSEVKEARGGEGGGWGWVEEGRRLSQTSSA